MAALLDGRLDAARRAALLADLDASPEDLELLADAAAVLGELEAFESDDDGSGPAPLPTDGGRDAAGLARATLPPGGGPDFPAAPGDGAGAGHPALPSASTGSASSPIATPAAAPPGVIALDVERTRRRGPGWKAVLPIAAVVAGLSVLPVVWKSGRAETDPGVYAHQGSFGAAGLPAGWNRAPWSATRGADDGLSPRARAVRLGVAITDLELAVAANDPRAAEIAGDVQRLLEPVPAAGAISQYYDGIAAGQVNGPAAEAAVGKARLAIARLPDGEMVLTGAWLEAARLAAARHDAAFFATAESREQLRKARASEEVPAQARSDLSNAVPTQAAPDAVWRAFGLAAASALAALAS
ncbi:MAG TPA: hypothetical protein VFH27_12175 [Longimicrobiaceae bacterium]|nr:hypothetical protein [Longimicrobiaceae bacterium]